MAAPARTHVLCCNCGVITPERGWTYWQRNDAGHPRYDAASGPGAGEWRPSRKGEGDPMMRCPHCAHEHEDSDGNAGLYEGTREEMVAERSRIADDFLDDWIETAKGLLP